MGGEVVDVDAAMNGDLNGSPTELAESEGEDNMEVNGEGGAQCEGFAQRELHRKRFREAGKKTVPDLDDGELDSPTKRAQLGDAPISARELRELLSGHVREMKSAWTNFQGRLDHLEGIQEHQGTELDKQKEALVHYKARTKALEKDAVSHRQAQEQRATWTNLRKK